MKTGNLEIPGNQKKGRPFGLPPYCAANRVGQRSLKVVLITRVFHGESWCFYCFGKGCTPKVRGRRSSKAFGELEILLGSPFARRVSSVLCLGNLCGHQIAWEEVATLPQKLVVSHGNDLFGFRGPPIIPQPTVCHVWESVLQQTSFSGFFVEESTDVQRSHKSTFLHFVHF